MGEGDEYVHRLAEYLVALVLGHVLYRPDVVETVGQLYDYDADVVVEGEEYPLEILGLQARLILVVVEGYLDFGEAVDEGGYLFAEEVFDILHRVVGIFHHVVEQGGAYRFIAQTYLRDHYPGHRHGVEDIGFAAPPPHVLVGFCGEVEGLLYHLALPLHRTPPEGGVAQGEPLLFYNLIILFGKRGHNSINSLNRAHRAPL